MSKKIIIEPTPDLTLPFSAALLGKAIKARRTQSKLRLADAAALCGVAKQTLLNIEHGLATIKLESLLKICAGLGVNLSVLSWDTTEGEESDDWQ